MIFNLNEQKVLSDPSGSSVFKGEKDFNDIVVNLPDNIDGHTATELNYVMHFVDSDGGYSTKILNVDSSGETLKATATVSTNITSKAQAFYAYVLMTDDEETVIGKTNGVIVMIHPVPDEENEIIPPADADKIIKGLEEIVKEATETIEEATEAISSKQDKLTAGENITITEENVISASSDYTDLTNKPSINNVTLLGNKSSDDLSLQDKLTAGENITIEDNVISASGGTDDYTQLENLPRITTSDGYKTLTGILSSNDIVFLKDAYLIQLSIDPTLFFHVKTPSKTRLDLDNLPSDYYGKAVYTSKKKEYYHNLPSFVYNSTATGSYIQFINFAGKNLFGPLQMLAWEDTQYKSHLAFRIHAEGMFNYDWQEIENTSIVSGTVNANGTITFTDSDGNTFTTTGSSVIGADGIGIADVHIDGGGDLIIEYTTGHMENVGHVVGADGQDYVLTAQDKSDIADIVLSELPTTQGVLYGNTSN